MSEAPFWSTPAPQPPPPPPRRGLSVAALAIMALVVGAIGGGAAGGYVAATRAGPAGEAVATAATSTPVPGPLPTAPPVVASAGGASDVVGVVNELLPTVVTVINRLPNGTAQSSGSGFVIDASNGYVVTNNHVVEDVRDTNPGASFDVIFADNRVVKDVKLIGRDDKTDVAILQVPAQNLKAAVLANSDDVPVGTTVVAIGSALGELQNTVTTGIVSAKGRRVPETDTVTLEDLIQTDAAINEGNSGGPLIWAATKQVIGMNTLVNRQAGAEGLGFSIASNTVRDIANELITNGKIDRGAIGIGYSLLSPRLAATLSLPAQTQGIIVTQIIAGSGAAQAGLKVNDVITKINDQQIDGTHPISSILLHTRPGDKVKLTIIRDGKQQTVDLTLGRQG
ncbi:MAG TPA: trypsin-like peptidase domain-containing protein [Candidatus Saccharimonadales bacterium]|jgi:S1-C subfamily serine protease|nr:trypsin-like peptidase domain-containing protein [Candidatus Saccharimonadales bacterium]